MGLIKKNLCLGDILTAARCHVHLYLLAQGFNHEPWMCKLNSLSPPFIYSVDPKFQKGLPPLTNLCIYCHFFDPNQGH